MRIDGQSIAFGSDGNLWFSDPGGGDRIGKLDPREGTVTFYPFYTVIRGVGGMTAGPDGNIWFTDAAQGGQGIGHITPGANITEFPLPNGGGRRGEGEEAALSRGACARSGGRTRRDSRRRRASQHR